MFQKEEVDTLLNSEVLTPWQQGRVLELQNRLSYLILKNLIDGKNLKGEVVDLGTGSGAGLVALRALGVIQVVGVENGSRLKKTLDRKKKIPHDPFEAFSPVDVLQPQISEMSNEQFLETAKKEGREISLITCFWIGYEPPIKQIEEVLKPGGQVIITADEEYRSYLKEIKTNLEIQFIEVPEYLGDLPVNDKFVLIGTKRN